MKICIITIIGKQLNDNYGGVLQSYALNLFLNRNGFEAYTMDIFPASNRSIFFKLVHSFKRGNIAPIIKMLLFKIFKRTNNINKELKREREEKFIYFKIKHIKFTEESVNPFFIKNELFDLINRFDTLIVGSDQVWNPSLNEDILNFFLLNFPFSGKKISYAASIGIPIPKKLIRIYKKCLGNFNNLSVREDESAKLLKDILGVEVDVSIDPVGLLDDEDWKSIMKCPELGISNPYIFVYDLVRSSEIIPKINELCDKLGIGFINCKYIDVKERKKLRNLQYSAYECGPEEFLWLLNNSEYVVSSSYHGVLLSIIFRKKFIAILPKKNIFSSMHSESRVLYLLNRLGLNHRSVYNVSNLSLDILNEKINYDDIKEKLDKFKYESISYLFKALR